MIFNPTLISGRLIKRYKRFLADVKLPDGSMITVHCANTGAMTGCAEPGWKVWLRDSQNPKRKCQYSWELVENAHQQMICVNTARANQVVAEAIQAGDIPALSGYETLTQEVRYGQEHSRIDMLLTDSHRADCYIEVKSVTLLTEQGLGLFPDAKSTRGQKHLRELMYMQEQGYRAVLFFAVMHQGIEKVGIAHHIDERYGELLIQAQQMGVEIICHRFNCDPQKIEAQAPLSFHNGMEHRKIS